MLNKVSYTLVVSLAVAIFTFGCGSGGVSSSSSAVDVGKLGREETLTYRTCTQDTDCIYAQNGCCDCANGGEAIAVKMSKLVEFEALFNCEKIVCTEIAANPPCEQGTVKCESRVCEFIRSASEPSLPSLQ